MTVLLFAILYLLGVLSYSLATRRSRKLLNEARERDAAALNHYREFVAGLAEASRQGILPAELERHCQNVELALKPRGGPNPADAPHSDPKTRQRADTGQREGSYALVAGLPDRDGDGEPDKPPPILDVLGDLYDDPARPARGDEGRTFAEIIAARVEAFDARTGVEFGSPREYRAAVMRVARDIFDALAPHLDPGRLSDRVRMLSADLDRVTQERDDALDALVRANNVMLTNIASNSVAAAQARRSTLNDDAYESPPDERLALTRGVE